MRLKNIFAVEADQKTKTEYQSIWNNLKLKFGTGEFKNINKNDVFENCNCHNSYARNTYTGKINNGINITELELSMICDSGFSHFGGESNIYSDGTFEVVIYTD